MDFCKILPHSADLKIRLEASSWAQLIQKAALSFSYLVLDSDVFVSREADKKLKIVLRGETEEEKLVNFFNDLIFILETQALLPKRGTVKEETFEGEFFRVKDNEIKERIKSATFHGLKVEKTAKGLKAEVIFDV